MFESHHHSETLVVRIEAGFGFCGRDIADGLKQTAVVEPIDPFQGCEFDHFQAPPRTLAMDHFGLKETNYGLCERVVVTVADTADRRLDPRFGETFGVPDRDIL